MGKWKGNPLRDPHAEFPYSHCDYCGKQLNHKSKWWKRFCTPRCKTEYEKKQHSRAMQLLRAEMTKETVNAACESFTEEGQEGGN